MSYPKISIVTPSYNQGKYLEATINSVIGQKYPNLEYIIIDGGSTDNSLEIIKKYEKHLAYWESTPDNGPAHAINKGFKRSTGEILAYLNSDDLYNSGAFEAVSELFLRHPEIDILYGDIKFIDEYGNDTRNPRSKVYKSIKVDFNMMASGIGIIPQQSSFWRRAVFFDVGMFNETNKTCWDGEFFSDALIYGATLRNIPKELARFRIHRQSISNKYHQSQVYMEEKNRVLSKFEVAGYKKRLLNTYKYNLIYYCRRISRLVTS